LTAIGWQVPDEVAARAAEVDDHTFVSDLFGERGVSSTKTDEWVRRKQALAVEMMRASPRLFPGAAALVRELERRFRLAVVSGTWRENVEAVVEAAGIASAFDAIVAKEDVTSPKPDPEPYLRALKRLRISARSTIAIDGSAAGIASARNAGLRAIAVGHRRMFGDWVRDAIFVPGLEPMEDLLRHLPR
jgi:beta-phosphoglucomutase